MKKAGKSAEQRHIATFEAYIAPIKSAILFGSDGAQVKLEIPGTELESAIALTANGQNKVLQVSIFEAE